MQNLTLHSQVEHMYKIPILDLWQVALTAWNYFMWHDITIQLSKRKMLKLCGKSMGILVEILGIWGFYDCTHEALSYNSAATRSH